MLNDVPSLLAACAQEDRRTGGQADGGRGARGGVPGVRGQGVGPPLRGALVRRLQRILQEEHPQVLSAIVHMLLGLTAESSVLSPLSILVICAFCRLWERQAVHAATNSIVALLTVVVVWSIRKAARFQQIHQRHASTIQPLRDKCEDTAISSPLEPTPLLVRASFIRKAEDYRGAVREGANMNSKYVNGLLYICH